MTEHRSRSDSYLTFLCQLYEAADGALVSLKVTDDEGNAELSPGELFQALTYLEEHGLVEVLASKPGEALVKVTLAGIELVETRLGARVDASAVEHRLRDRARFLECLYEEVEGNHMRRVSSIKMSSKLGLPIKEVDLLARYWEEDGGAEVLGHKGDDWVLRITSQGVDDVEELATSVSGMPVGVVEEVRPGDHAQPSEGTTSAGNVFLKQGDTWTVGYSGAVFPLGDSKGMHYLAFLISHPNESFTAADLFEAVEQPTLPGAERRSSLTAVEIEEAGLVVSGPSDAGTVIDGETRRDVWREIQELKAQEEDALQRNDTGALEALREKREEFEDYLVGAIGLGGRHRRAADDYRRIRQRVYMNISRALRRLQGHQPELHTHLENSIRTAPLFAYRPDRDITWST